MTGASSPRFDVAVVGAGPAGLAAAAACASAALRVVAVAPDPEAVWPATYGVWLDELAPMGLEPFAAHRWPSVVVRGLHDLVVDRAYGLLDNRALAGQLRRRVTEGGGVLLEGHVEGAQHFTWGTRLLLGDGCELDAGVVVDASGAIPAVLARGAGPDDPAIQAAWGIVAHVDHPPLPAGSCLLMDWGWLPDDETDPTFLYAMDLGGGVWFLEETSLARLPELPADRLRERLGQRLDHLGVRVTDLLATEHVRIPLGLPVPGADEPVVGFGTAASLAHPASGYSVGAALRLAPVLAGELAAARDRRAGPAASARVGLQAVWPGWRRRARFLESYGLSVLLRLDQGELRTFFDAFFRLPTADWTGYLAGTLPPRRMAGVMARTFRTLPGPLRRSLLTGDPVLLARALSG